MGIGSRTGCLERVAPAALLLFLPFLGCQAESLVSPQCELAQGESAGGSWERIPMAATLIASDGDELVAMNQPCASCEIGTLDPEQKALESTPFRASVEQRVGVHAMSGCYVLDAFGPTFESGALEIARTAVLIDRCEGSISLVEAPESYRDRGSGATVHWTGESFLIFGGIEALPPGSLQPDTPIKQYHDGILFDPAGGTWRPVPAAREDGIFLSEKGRPSVLSTWTNAGLFVWATNVERTENWGAVFDVESMSWEMLDVTAGAPPVIEYGSLLAVGDDVFLFGGRPGRSGDGTYSRAMWRFSLTTKTWSEVDVPAWADPQAGTVIRDRLAFTGRCLGGQLYDPATDSWKPLSPAGANPQLGSVPRAAGSFLTVTDENAHISSGHLWILDLRQELGE
jgi:Kelch motif